MNSVIDSGRVGTSRTLMFLLLLFLGACGNRPAAPIYDRSTQQPTRTQSDAQRPADYQVVRGDTLYAIAWRYGIDYRTLAGWNAIDPPYTIYPQQKIRLNAPSVQVNVPATASPSQNRPAPKPPPTPKPTVTRRAAPPQGQVRPTRDSIAWRWPTEGQVTRSFVPGSTSRKGLDIAGQLGQSIHAAAAGHVVYSGVGLIGYGELIIIKHDERYLSAYGHSSKRLVEQGSQVLAGQKIAEMGTTGSDRPLLHFEIRMDGKPIDPQDLLPKR